MLTLISEYYIISCGLFGLVSAQVLKPFFGFIRHRKFNLEIVFASGGFPSSHTSFVVGTTTAIALKEGLSSPSFALGLVVSMIVMYDAMNVRYYAGKNIELTQQIIKDLKKHEFKLDNPLYINNLKEILGHERLEVLGGFILGIASPFIINLII